MIRLDTEKSSPEQVIIEHSMICCYRKFLFLEPPLGNGPLRITEHEDKSRENPVPIRMICLAFFLHEKIKEARTS